MFKIRNTVVVNTNEVPPNILKKFLLSYPANIPKYFKDIPSKFFDNKNRHVNSSKSLRTCSGFINLFKRSLLFTSPYDIEIFIDDQISDSVSYKTVRGSVGGRDFNHHIKIHPNWQFINHIKSDYSMIIKFMPYFTFQSNYNMFVINPWWHLNQFETIPGVINCKEPMEMNVFIPVKKGVDKIYIPQGTPLCHITFDTNKEINLKFTDKEHKYEYFLGPNYTFNNLKRYILNNILKEKE